MERKLNYAQQMLPKTASIRDAMTAMTGATCLGMVLVVDSRDKLLGAVVDSDLRKAMLQGHGLNTPLSKIMNKKPFTLSDKATDSSIRNAIQKKPRALIPLVDSKNRVCGLVETIKTVARIESTPNWVVLLVGGLGSRLYPLTKKRPKPLLPLGDKPLLETIIEQFVSAGFRNIILAINHKGDQIKKHFKNGKKLGATIEYVIDKKKLGTAGPLSMIKRKFDKPVIVMNGDVLTKIDFHSLMHFHQEDGNIATMAVREYDFQVPYGVVKIDGNHMKGIEEKPTHRFFVNAGIYVLEPEAISQIPTNQYFDMPKLLDKLGKRRRKSVGCFPIREYWIDIGRLPDYEQARDDYKKVFDDS